MRDLYHYAVNTNAIAYLVSVPVRGMRDLYLSALLYYIAHQ